MNPGLFNKLCGDLRQRKPSRLQHRLIVVGMWLTGIAVGGCMFIPVPWPSPNCRTPICSWKTLFYPEAGFLVDIPEQVFSPNVYQRSRYAPPHQYRSGEVLWQFHFLWDPAYPASIAYEPVWVCKTTGYVFDKTMEYGSSLELAGHSPIAGKTYSPIAGKTTTRRYATDAEHGITNSLQRQSSVG